MSSRKTLIGAAVVSGLLIVGPLQSSASAATDVARWKMEDSNHTMLDSSGNGRHGKSTSNVRLRQPGFSGFGYEFNATPSYVTVPSSSALNPGTAAFSVTARIRFSTRPPGGNVDTYDIVRKGVTTTSGGEWKLEIMGSGAAHCLFKGSGGQGELFSGQNLADGKWHTVTCKRTSSAVTLVVDGVSRSISARTGTISNTQPVRLGAKNTSGHDQYRGFLDEVVVTRG